MVELAGAGRSCREGGLRPSGLALKGKAAALVLTEGSRQPGLQRRRSATGSRGESRAALGEDLLQGISWLLVGTARPKAVLREGYGGQGGSGVTGGEELQWRRCLPAAWGLCSERRRGGAMR